MVVTSEALFASLWVNCEWSLTKIDFVKYSLHLETTDYVNSLLLNNFLPVIYTPTRITTKAATLIDHIYYYEGAKIVIKILSSAAETFGVI